MSSIKIHNFMKFRHAALAMSVIFILISIVTLAVRGLNLGLDFTGGTLIELQFAKAPDPQALREILTAKGFHGANVVQFGSDTDILIRMQTDDADAEEGGAKINIGQRVVDILKAEGFESTLSRSEVTGTQVGGELINQGGLGLLASLGAVFLYVAVQFQYKFSVGAIVALIHDVIVVLGFFSLFQLEFDLTVLAAVLAVIGYSLNDTIVIFDRIRENFRRMRDVTAIELVNVSLSETLIRTLMTSGTVFLTVISLFIFGGDLIHNFATALLVGIGVGTYSSIYIAAAILLLMKVSKEDLMTPVKEGAELDERP